MGTITKNQRGAMNCATTNAANPKCIYFRFYNNYQLFFNSPTLRLILIAALIMSSISSSVPIKTF